MISYWVILKQKLAVNCRVGGLENLLRDERKGVPVKLMVR